MRNRKVSIASAVGIILALSCLPISRVKAQIKGFTTGSWVHDDKVGFSVWTAANYVVHAAAFDHRHIFIFIEPANFNEQSILKLFNSLADKARVPDNLEMIAYSDRRSLQKALVKETEGVCVLWVRSPEGTRASRDFEIKTSPRKSGYFRAEYQRNSNGKEVRVQYSPAPKQEHLKIIYHANKPFEYSDPNNDLINAAEKGDLEALNRDLSRNSSEERLKSAGDKALSVAASNGQH